MKPHKHKDLIIAWATGETVQIKSALNDWIDIQEYFGTLESPIWYSGMEYRITPEPTPDFYKYIVFDAPKSLNSKFEQIVKTNMYGCEQEFDFGKDTPEAVKQEISQLKLTFDGETGKLKAAEVLK